ncbi:MAG: DUF58 domain-containing protein [Acidimicrobiales bacterium]
MPRPRHPAGPIGLSVIVLALWEIVAHNSGSGWVQLLGALLAGALLVGLVGPGIALLKLRVACTWCPPDATAGEPVDLSMALSGRCRVVPLDPPGRPCSADAELGAVGTSPPPRETGCTLRLLPEHRGVYDSIACEVESAFPFGLLWWRCKIRLSLPSRLHVAPRIGTARSVAPAGAGSVGLDIASRTAPTGDHRAVRAYRPGDHRRMVHWPATAHAGSLMVRETDDPGSPPVALRVTLPEDPGAAEAIAGQALATVVDLLRQRRQVILATVEAGGPRIAAVPDELVARRRLAAAVAGPDHRPEELGR